MRQRIVNVGFILALILFIGLIIAGIAKIDAATCHGQCLYPGSCREHCVKAGHCPYYDGEDGEK